MLRPNIQEIATRSGSSEVKLPVNLEPEPTILLGSNASGKTTAFTLLSLISLGNVATAFESPIVEATFRMRDGSRLAMTNVAPESDEPRYSDFSTPDADEYILVRDTTPTGRTRDYRYSCELAQSERSTWVAQDALVGELLQAPLSAYSEPVKALLQRAIERRAALDRAITSMVACGYPSDFQSNTSFQAPEWLKRFAVENPVRLLGVHRVGIPMSRLVHEQMRTERDRARDTLWYMTEDRSLTGAAVNAVAHGVISRPPVSAFENLDEWREALEAAYKTGHAAAWEVVNSAFQNAGDISLYEKSEAFARYVSEYIGAERGKKWIGLSSGEQHIVSMFHAVLFTFPAGSVVLVDEPELSLHVAWQLSIARDLAEAAALRGSRVVLATHSPAIVNDWWDNVVEIGRASAQPPDGMGR